jgi:hypothetical protein
MDAAVVYIDTELKFSQQRLIHIMQQQGIAARRLSGASPTGQSAAEVMQRVKATVPPDVAAHVEATAQRVHIIRPQTGVFPFCCSLLRFSQDAHSRLVVIVEEPDIGVTTAAMCFLRSDAANDMLVCKIFP